MGPRTKSSTVQETSKDVITETEINLTQTGLGGNAVTELVKAIQAGAANQTQAVADAIIPVVQESGNNFSPVVGGATGPVLTGSKTRAPVTNDNEPSTALVLAGIGAVAGLILLSQKV